MAAELGIQGFTADDQRVVAGSRFGVVRDAVFANWRKIGTITFDAAAVSFNGDRVFHVNHPAWREDRNDPRTVVPSKV